MSASSISQIQKVLTLLVNWKPLTVLIIIITGLVSCNKSDEFQKMFESKFPKPEWFADVEAQTLNSNKEVTALWRSEKRCCGEPEVKKNKKIMFKSCYNAILNHYQNEELVVGCIPKMVSAMSSPQRNELWKYLVETYPDNKKDLTRCSNCMEADTIARATYNLARYENGRNQNASKSISLIENFMDKRGRETSPWIKAEAFELIGKLYLEKGVTSDIKLRYQETYEQLSASVKLKSVQKWRLKNFEKVHKLIMSQ